MRKIPITVLILFVLFGCAASVGPNLRAKHEVNQCITDNLGDCLKDENVISYRILGYGPSEIDAKKAAHLYLKEKFPGRKILAEYWDTGHDPVFGAPFKYYVIQISGGAKQF